MNTISTRNVKAISFPLPPFDLQTTFAEQVERIEALARGLDTAAAKAEAMAAALSAEVFETGSGRDSNLLPRREAAD